MRALVAAACFLIALAMARAAEPVAEAPTCVLVAAEGKVEVARKGSPQWAAAQAEQVLQIGDRLRTGLRSRATLRWSGLSVVRVDQLTSMEIQPPAKAGDKPQLDLKSGASYFFSREKPGEIQFRTPAASGAIRGTEFNLAVDANGHTELTLVDGEVDLVAAQGQASLQSGEQAVVDPGGAPKKSVLLNAINVIQWVLYYPVVLDAAELGLTKPEEETFASVLNAYRSGDLLAAVNAYPENRQPASDGERLLAAALALAVGRVDQAEDALKALSKAPPAANAVRELIAAVKNQPLPSQQDPTTASEWLARSYLLQSQSKLDDALAAARAAVEKSPSFGAAWIRLAELEFGFGRTRDATAALARGRDLSPRNAQGLALEGFLLAAKGKSAEAQNSFDRAIAVDPALANAWLGRGLVRIHRLQVTAGRADLQVATALEPQRAVLRSYLGKAFGDWGDATRAEKELGLARKLDPNDPTSWLYSALLLQQQNRLNEAVEDLEHSKELNSNRSLFRSRLLLDQDQAVRSANLAAIYRDAGLLDFGTREASRAVNLDYGNHSAHLFLADSFDAQRDPKLLNLRYETPWFSELLVSQLLAPVGAGSLSQNISQQEYSRLFDANHVGLFTSTEYFSSGDWVQRGSQYGVIEQSSYSLDASFRTENGQRPNNDLEQLYFSGRFKQQITAQDSVFLQGSWFDYESGDVAQYYNQNSAGRGLRVKERQEPNLLLGYHHEWSPGNHTLFLASRFDDTLDLEDSAPALLFYRTFVSPFSGLTNRSLQNPALFSLDYRSELEAYSAEVQQIWQTPEQTLVAGARYQAGWSDTDSTLDRQLTGVVADQSVDTSLDRFSAYAYENWRLFDPLLLTAGVSYDRLHFPRNIDTAPVTGAEATKDRVSPKAGFLWSPLPDTHVRGIYSRSLGGVFFDTSVRLEPTQIAGFNQAFRSLVPESVAGLVPGTRFETFGIGLDQAIQKTRTYFVVEGEFLNSDGTRTVGLLTNSDVNVPVPDSISSGRQSLEYHERSLVVSGSQLLGKYFSAGARYKLTEADLDTDFAGLSGVAGASQDVAATLHQVYLFANFYHACGGFAQFNTVWSQQSNRGYTQDIPGDDFWQFNAYVGYRFLDRRAEAKLGLLNISDQDYRLNPLTLYNELPRERTLVASFKFYF
jgi:predicted Zn-dependent protease